MTSFVITLIGNAQSMPLGSEHIEAVWHNLSLNSKNGQPGDRKKDWREDWLAENEACDLFFESSLHAAELTKLARHALFGMAIDVACTPVPARRKKLLIADMDSTVIEQECIDEMGAQIGLGRQIHEITAAVIDGEISFSDALRKRMALMKGLELSLLEKVYEERISLKKGALTLVSTMRENGAYCILVSGGFSFFTSRIAKRLGFNEHRANELVIENGKLTGEVKEPILGRSAKLTTLLKLCKTLNIAPFDVLAVGDGANDIKMIKAAGMGVAFCASNSFKACSNICINHADLSALLYMQGYRRSQFVASREADHGYERTA